MLINTILNRIQHYDGFVFGANRLIEKASTLILEIKIYPRAGSHPKCSGCDTPGPGYDTLPTERRFEFIPFWGITVFFLYHMRRVECPRCGVKVERVPWAEGKNHVTTAFAWFIAKWAKRLSWKECAEAFNTKWDNVYHSVKMAVAYGLANRNLDNIGAIGIDEIFWKKIGTKFLTLVYQIDGDCKRLLWIGKDRKQQTLKDFFEQFTPERSKRLRTIFTDMWKPYLDIIAKMAPQALNILDRFHIMSHMSKAIDKVRTTEVKTLKAKGLKPVLTNSRWCLLKRPENRTEKQIIKLQELVGINLKTVKAFILKEDFQRFWEYKSAAWAGKFLDVWCTRTMRSRIDPMKKVARMLRSHRPLILNWFKVRGQISLGAVEGLNNKSRVVTKRAYGYKSFEVIKLALYHTLGMLPEPKFTHKFCN